MNKSLYKILTISTVFIIICISCSDNTIKKIRITEYQKFNLQRNVYSVEVLEYYPFIGNKLFTKNWANIYLCREIMNNDTILLFEIKKKVPSYISERKIVRYLIFNNEKEECPDEISVNYPDSIKISKSYKIVCGKLGYLHD
jgi:hypothetical protein